MIDDDNNCETRTFSFDFHLGKVYSNKRLKTFNAVSWFYTSRVGMEPFVAREEIGLDL